MPKYIENIVEQRQAEYEKYVALIKTGRLNASVGWPISGLKNKLKRNLALAELGVHEFYEDTCNCGLVATRFKRTGHRVHGTQDLAKRQFRLVIVVGEQTDY